MNRRNFLSLLGLAPLAVVAPKVTYSFLGGILRPRKPYYLTATEIMLRREEWLRRVINPTLYVSLRDMVSRLSAKSRAICQELGDIKPVTICDDIPDSWIT